MTRAAPAWCLRLTVPAPALAPFEAALASLGGALVTGATDAAGRIPLDAYLAAEPERAELTALFAAAALAAGCDLPPFTIERLPETDWVAESRKALPAIHAGPFYVYGAHITEPPPAEAIALEIEASVAFGTGRHESTRGCLLALAELAKGGRAVRSALDMGCGTGILALAAARLWDAPVLAADNDADSVRLAAENAAKNGLSDYITAVLSDGYAAAAIAQAAPFDLIIANILAEPLSAMAPELGRHLAPGGTAILSGLLAEQAERVVAAHAPLTVERTLRLEEWATLILRDPAPPGN